MKRKIWKNLLALIMALCLSFSLAACGEPEGKTPPGDDGTCVHQYTAENVCSLCGREWKFSEGFTYDLDETTDTYHVLQIQKASGDVVVPYGYQGKFVTAVFGWTKEEIIEIAEGENPDPYIPDSLTGITLPDSVMQIGGYSFMGCSGLRKVNLGHGLISIGEYAFGSCEGLTNITIPDSVTSIGEAAFAGCSALNQITIGSGVTQIGHYAFEACKELDNIQFKGTVAAWQAIEEGSAGLGTVFTVTCTDGVA